MRCVTVGAAGLSLLSLTSQAWAHDPAELSGPRAQAFYLNSALAPMLNVQMVEGPVRDDVLIADSGLTSSLSLTYAALKWLELGVWLQYDVGRTRRARYARPDPDTGLASETDVIEGGYGEFWGAVMVRGRYGPLFGEFGWAPLIVRHDSARTDLPNVNGETDGLFVGSRTVAYLGGVGGAVELAPDVELTLRLQARIRYLVSRGGEDLADGEEFGNIFVAPSLGIGYRFP